MKQPFFSWVFNFLVFCYLNNPFKLTEIWSYSLGKKCMKMKRGHFIIYGTHNLNRLKVHNYQKNVFWLAQKGILCRITFTKDVLKINSFSHVSKLREILHINRILDKVRRFFNPNAAWNTFFQLLFYPTISSA